MTASLPMYWRAENAHLWRGFWACVQDSATQDGLTLPDLTPPERLPTDWTEHWLDPALVLSMTCGLPFRSALRGKVRYVGTLTFGLPCPAGHYLSVVIQHRDAATVTGRPVTLAYNAPDSQSGWAASQMTGPDSPKPDIRQTLHTGSHAASLAAVAEGQADLAFLDAVTWRILQRFDPQTQAVRVVGHSPNTPALPLITALGSDPGPLRRAVQNAVASFAPNDPLMIGGPLGWVVLDPRDYLSLPLPQPPMAM